ncbi:MAG: tyrosine recombinase XerC [Gammaproteobacteria bacterium]|nr:MAG: tyrosine recombinase XerC [Gammaproteobacteria bacterium]
MQSKLFIYLAQLIAEKQLSEHTVRSYRKDIEDFFYWYAQSEQHRIDHRSMQYFIAYLNRKKMAPSSIARKLSALRQYFDFLIEQGVLQNNPAKGIKPPKRAKVLPKALSVDDINQLLDHPEQFFDLHNPLQQRDYAMLELLYSTGLRVAELASLDTHDIDLSNGQATVIGKGNKERIVLIGSKAQRALKQWLRMRSKVTNEKHFTNALFLNQRGKRLSVRGIQQHIKQIGQRFDLNLNLHPHMLRHSFASHVLQSSGDLRAVQEMLGHSDISSTQIYTHLDFQHLARVYDETHPRAKKNNKK